MTRSNSRAHFQHKCYKQILLFKIFASVAFKTQKAFLKTQYHLLQQYFLLVFSCARLYLSKLKMLFCFFISFNLFCVDCSNSFWFFGMFSSISIQVQVVYIFLFPKLAKPNKVWHLFYPSHCSLEGASAFASYAPVSTLKDCCRLNYKIKCGFLLLQSFSSLSKAFYA